MAPTATPSHDVVVLRSVEIHREEVADGPLSRLPSSFGSGLKLYWDMLADKTDAVIEVPLSRARLSMWVPFGKPRPKFCQLNAALFRLGP